MSLNLNEFTIYDEHNREVIGHFQGKYHEDKNFYKGRLVKGSLFTTFFEFHDARPGWENEGVEYSFNSVSQLLIDYKTEVRKGLIFSKTLHILSVGVDYSSVNPNARLSIFEFEVDEATAKRVIERYNLSKSKYKPVEQVPTTINDIDLMSGYEFEDFLGDFFSQRGYKVLPTGYSQDQGIDLIIEKDGKRIGVQAKCYSNPVGNKAIQETVAGINYHNCTHGMVITNSSYTRQALDLASKNNIILWDRNKLNEEIHRIV
ncbi:restriction endonuclease [Bacillus sp. T3]|uniref:restriction endonuclease n=1 Tax=Bacillus sp. T3 TaxID=467262 RepID=UPI0029829E8A|nr:restriction endonuclease [Bacillus sp. T3]